MVPQVVAVLAGHSLGLPQGVDLPDGLCQLEIEALLHLLELDLRLFFGGVIQ